MDLIENIISNIATKHFGDYRVRNGEVVAELCPYCGGGENRDRGTFAINIKTGAYNCKRGGCEKKGTLQDLCSFLGEEDSVVNIPHTFIKKNKEYTKPNIELKPLTEEIVTYFYRRRISEETLKEFEVSSDEHGNIVFPFYRDNVLTYVKFRKPKKHTKEDGPKEWQMANTEPILFGMDKVAYNKPLVITEGEIDALSIYEAGYHNVVSVPSGCDNMAFLDTCKKWLDKFSNFIIFGDNDEPGRRMVCNLVEELGKDRCLIPQEYPAFMWNGKDYNRACKDANEILVLYGAETLLNCVNSCELAPIEGVLNLSDVAFVDPTTIPRIYSKIPSLDNLIGGFAEGSLTIVSGRRGEGKSTFSGPVALNAIQQGENVCAYSGELSASQFLEWIMSQAVEEHYLTVSTDPNTGKHFPVVPYDIQQRIRKWLNNKFYLFDNTANHGKKETDAVLEAFKMCARRYGCKLFIVDNLLSLLRSTSDNENKAQADFTAELKAFAVKYNVAVIMVA